MTSDPRTGLACPRCRTELKTAGPQKFRVGGTGGAFKLILGEWAELGESMIALEVLVCPQCKYVELYAPDATEKK
jgi:uncharacterized protein YbaR (Trm112 family)